MSTEDAEGAIALHIQQLKSHFKVATDEQLADKLGMSKQNIGNWRRRGAIPLKVRENLYNQHGVVFGSRTGEMIDISREFVAYAAGLKIASSVLQELGREPTVAEWRALGKGVRQLVRGIQSTLETLRSFSVNPDEWLGDLMADDRQMSEYRKYLLSALGDQG